eukprot:1936567-Pyramimonas_sp.AAC.1
MRALWFASALLLLALSPPSRPIMLDLCHPSIRSERAVVQSECAVRHLRGGGAVDQSQGLAQDSKLKLIC